MDNSDSVKRAVDAAWQIIEYASNAHVDKLERLKSYAIPGSLLVVLEAKLRAAQESAATPALDTEYDDSEVKS